MHRRALLLTTGAVLGTGCVGTRGGSRGTIELNNFSSEPVSFTVGVEPAGRPDTEQTPTYRESYYTPPMEDVVLPGAVAPREHRVSVLVHEYADGERGSFLDDGQIVFRPGKDATTLYAAYGAAGGDGLTLERS